MEDIVSRFRTGPHPGKQGRYCIREAWILRKAKFKTVRRWAILCNDVLVICGVVRGDGPADFELEQKQVLELEDVEINERVAVSKAMPFAFELHTPVRSFVVGTQTAVEREAWIAAIRRAVSQNISHIRGPSEANEQLYKGTLHYCAWTDNSDEASEILAAAANREQLWRVDEEGLTAVHVAILRGHIRTLRVLHEAGGKLDAARDGRSVLHLAAECADPRVFDYLLKHKVAIEARRSGDGLTALAVVCFSPLQHLRSRRGDVRTCVACLCKWGADVDVVVGNDDDGGGDDGGAPRQPLLHKLAEQDLLVACLALLAGGAFVNTVDQHGNTAAHAAASSSSLRALRCLLQHGVQPNARNFTMDTALHVAASARAAALLVAYGARLELVNTAGVAAYVHTYTTKEGLTKLKALEASVDKVSLVAPSGGKQHGNGGGGGGDGARVPMDATHPRWTRDDESNGCVICYSKFTVTSRRHHCRKCGLLLCGACSSKSFCHDDKQYRACMACFNVLRSPLADRLVDDDDDDDDDDDEEEDGDDAVGGGGGGGDGGIDAAIAYAMGVTRKATRPKFTGKSTSDSNLLNGSGSGGKAPARRAATGTEDMHHMRDVAERRGRVIKEVEQKAEHMNDEAATFHENCKALREKM